MIVCFLVVLGVVGRVIIEYCLMEGELFSVINVYWYNKYFDDFENLFMCIFVMYCYYVIFILLKDFKENVKQMVEKYVEDNNIGGFYRYDFFGIFFYY